MASLFCFLFYVWDFVFGKDRERESGRGKREMEGGRKNEINGINNTNRDSPFHHVNSKMFKDTNEHTHEHIISIRIIFVDDKSLGHFDICVYVNSAPYAYVFECIYCDR